MSIHQFVKAKKLNNEHAPFQIPDVFKENQQPKQNSNNDDISPKQQPFVPTISVRNYQQTTVTETRNDEFNSV